MLVSLLACVRYLRCKLFADHAACAVPHTADQNLSKQIDCILLQQLLPSKYGDHRASIVAPGQSLVFRNIAAEHSIVATFWSLH
jgi:hypothetical protein